MRYAASLLLAATPAAAHQGVHLHPHGIDAAWTVLAAAAAVAGLVAIRVRSRRK
jgi:hypothetical protein